MSVISSGVSAINVTVRNPWGAADLREFEPFLREQQLSYEGYQNWATKATQQLHAGEKGVLLAFDHGSLVGNVIYQPHREIPGLLEIKNSRVAPRARRRYLVTFMKKQVEHLARERGYAGIIKDVREEQTDALAVAIHLGYEPLAIHDVYGEGKQDFVMVKWLSEPDREQYADLIRIVEPNTERARQTLDTVLS